MDAIDWKPIKDIPDSWYSKSSDELSGFARVWREQSDRLRNSRAIEEFNNRLCREWAIETGIIENLYTIDRGVTQLLIEQGIHASLLAHGSTNRAAEEIIPLLKDQEGVVQGLFDYVKQSRQLTTSLIKEIHAALTRHQNKVRGVDSQGRWQDVDLLRGEWKRQPNNPTRDDGSVHLYCPPVHVASEMDNLVRWHDEHLHKGVPPEVEAAWLHHRFTQIHPFQDGNGRVARALASLVFLQEGWFPLLVRRDDRGAYIAALESADRGDLSDLVTLFIKIQKSSFLKVFSLSEDVLEQHEPRMHMLDAIKERLRIRFEGEQQEQAKKLQDISLALEEATLKQLTKYRAQLKKQLADVPGEIDFSVKSCPMDGQNDYWYQQHILAVAREMDYFADLRGYRSWFRLCIHERKQLEMVFSFHGVGRNVSGIRGVHGFLIFRTKGEGNSVELDGPYPLSKEPFQFFYHDDKDKVLQRYDAWLSQALLVGLDHWRREI